MTEEIKQEEMVCPKCGAPLKVRNGKFGQFLGCSNYPECTYTDFKTLKGKTESATQTTTSGKTATKTSGYAKTTTVKLDPDTVIEELKKSYDEVVAEFGNDYPESIADPKTLQAIVSTVFIEKNNRRKGR